MFTWLFEKIFGTYNSRVIRQYHELVEQINKLEATYARFSDQEIITCTQEWKIQAQNKQSKIDDLLVPMFALVREAAKRTINQRHFDVQLLGGITLHKGQIAEMQTGEGKTLVATLPACLNALQGKVHIVTVNDYLARRDAQWMGEIYSAIGLTTGYITTGMTDLEKQKAYKCDIIYGTNSELGFDYLRDNMKVQIEDIMQCPLDYAIIDEVDSILIDEARTPLIISAPTQQNSKLYPIVDNIIRTLNSQHYDHDEKKKTVYLTDQGIETIEQKLKNNSITSKYSGLYDIQNVHLLHLVNQSLRAHIAFKKNKDYLVRNGQVVIIDEFTGRIMSKSRYADGLHQALEAKEKVKIESENQILSSISFQNFFRLYNKLSGMTGTASTEANEFKDIYNLEVITIPTNVPSIRQDLDDLIYRKQEYKNQAIVAKIVECYSQKQPVLVGTTSVEKSEILSKLLKQSSIPHNVLNAKNHEKEAEIINQAGRLGAVTIATNMAGRGTDIKLGGMITQNHTQEAVKQEAEQVGKLGGLFVIGTEKNESRRIDNQLRGRTGRQGSAGITQFFVSLEDDLMRIFGGDKIDSIMQSLGIKDDEVISHRWITSSLEGAQQKIESYNYEIRKNLIQYDDIINSQRQFIYELRNQFIYQDSHNEFINQSIAETLTELAQTEFKIDEYITIDREYIRKIIKYLCDKFGFKSEELEMLLSNYPIQEGNLGSVSILLPFIQEKLDKFQTQNPQVNKKLLFKEIILSIIDQEWRQYLSSLGFIKKSSSLKAYASKNPLNEYKIEAFNLFSELNKKISKLISYYIINLANGRFMLSQGKGVESKSCTDSLPDDHNIRFTNKHKYSTDSRIDSNVDSLKDSNQTTKQVEIGLQKRNELCRCNSGIKYKHCHGKI